MTCRGLGALTVRAHANFAPLARRCTASRRSRDTLVVRIVHSQNELIDSDERFSAGKIAQHCLERACEHDRSCRACVVNCAVPHERVRALLGRGFTQAEVEQILGSPSVTATFRRPEDTWYYISSEFEAYGIFAPEAVRRRILAVNFDESLRVKEVERFELEDGQEVAMVERETPTRGKELSLLQQLFGNLGRFNDVSPSSN